MLLCAATSVKQLCLYRRPKSPSKFAGLAREVFVFYNTGCLYLYVKVKNFGLFLFNIHRSTLLEGDLFDFLSKYIIFIFGQIWKFSDF